MRKFTLIVLVLAVVACKNKEADKAPVEATKPVDEVVAPKEQPPAATPKELAAKLAACSGYVECSNLQKGLDTGGAAIAPDLVKVAVDTKRPKEAREVAAKALVASKTTGTGMALFDAAKADTDFLIRGPLYEAAGASGDEAVFTAAGAHLLTQAGWDDRIQVSKALHPFGKKTFDWAAAEIVKTKKFSHVSTYGDLIANTATAAELPAVEKLLAAIKEPMARNHLAAAAAKLGSTTAFDVLLANLGSKENLERNDAGSQLASAVDKVPADKKAAFAAAVEKAKASDTARTMTPWDEILGKLK